MDAEFPSRPPAGFITSTTRGPFSARNGPYFHKVEEGLGSGTACGFKAVVAIVQMVKFAFLAWALVPLGIVRRRIRMRDQRYTASVSSQ